jgi:hypothetical protein
MCSRRLVRDCAMSGFVEVYQREDHKIYVQSCSRVSGGHLVGNGWAGAIAGDASDAEVGRLVMDGLSRTELDIPEVSREDVEKLLRPLLKLAGVRSFTCFAAGTRSAGVERDIAGTLTLIPTENRGKRGKFFYLPDELILAPPFDEAAVGRAVCRVLSMSKTRT